MKPEPRAEQELDDLGLSYDDWHDLAIEYNYGLIESAEGTVEAEAFRRMDAYARQKAIRVAKEREREWERARSCEHQAETEAEAEAEQRALPRSTFLGNRRAFIASNPPTVTQSCDRSGALRSVRPGLPGPARLRLVHATCGRAGARAVVHARDGR
jgi:hypothetical protein